MFTSSTSQAVPRVPAPPLPALVVCSTGCTDACPGDADGHPVALCYPHAVRIHAEWNDCFTRLSAAERPQMLPPGWVHEAHLADFEVGGIDMDLVQVPSRVVEKPTTRMPSPAEREVGVGGTWPGCWVLVRRNHRVGLSQVADHETNLWRLFVKMRDRERDRPVNIFDEPDKSVADWLGEVVAGCYDLADPAQAAEQMLHVLSGQFRNPPPSTLLRP